MKECFLSQKGPKPVGPYSSAVKSGNLVFISGVGPTFPDGSPAITSGAADEAPQVMKNLGTILEEMGLSFADVVKTNIYLTDINDFAAVNAIYKSFFSGDYPARTTVAVNALPGGIHCEIEMVAALRD